MKSTDIIKFIEFPEIKENEMTLSKNKFDRHRSLSCHHKPLVLKIFDFFLAHFYISVL